MRYYLERRDPEFEPKMAEVLCVYREVEMRRAAPGGAAREPAVAVISYDEKPGIQAIGAIAPDLRPVPGTHPTISRDHEYKRHGTVVGAGSTSRDWVSGTGGSEGAAPDKTFLAAGAGQLGASGRPG